ncbi:MAG: DUF4124 domain-containing protein [Pseudomonadota bacterium]
MTKTHAVLAATLAGALLFAGAPAAHAQGVYKWVDANGKVHYGSQPPAAEKGPEPVKMHSSSGFGGNNNSGSGAAAKPQYNADGTKKIPKGVEDMRDGLVKGLQQVDPKTEALSCVKAVENVRYQLDLMIEVGQRNTKDGYITQAEYDTTAAKLRQAKSEISLTDCDGATGTKRAFYQCMSSSRNHVSGCGAKHKF